MMLEDTIESILARFLLEPGFLEKTSAHPVSALQEYSLEPETRAQLLAADFDQIRRFSGFIGKVQHNHLWGSFPATRLLLVFYGIELDVFAEYRATQLAPRTLGLGRDARIRCFLNFLKNYLRRRDCPGLLEVLAHERNVWESRIRARAGPFKSRCAIDVSSLPWRAFLRLSVRVNETLQLGSYRFDPVVLVQRVCEGGFEGKLPEPQRQVIAYVADGRGELRMLELDPLSVTLLSQAGRQRTVKTIIAAARARGLEKIRPSAFRQFFETADAAALISLAAPKESRCG